MSSTLAKAAILFFALSATVATGGALAQSLDLPSEARLVGFTVEPESPEFGQAFDLRITVRIGPGLSRSFRIHWFRGTLRSAQGRGTGVRRPARPTPWISGRVIRSWGS